jgi:hypothetical protein
MVRQWTLGADSSLTAPSKRDNVGHASSARSSSRKAVGTSLLAGSSAGEVMAAFVIMVYET